MYTRLHNIMINFLYYDKHEDMNRNQKNPKKIKHTLLRRQTS